MDKNLALKKLNHFKKIKEILQETGEEVFRNQKLKKIDRFDVKLIMCFGGAMVLFLSTMLSVILEEMEIITKIPHVVFMVLSFEILLFSCINYIAIKTNKKANQYSGKQPRPKGRGFSCVQTTLD